MIRDSFRDARFPKELIPEMGRLGFFGANLEGYGCAGMNNVEYGLVMQELERGDSGIRSFASVQGALVMYPILTYGSEEQKQQWLPKLQSGEALGCFGLTEPGFGSNPAGMLTRGGEAGLVLGAQRRENLDHEWIGGRYRDRVGARRGWNSRIPGGKGHAGIHVLASCTGNCRCARRSPRALRSAMCRVPESAMLPGAKGLKGPLGCLSQARYGIGWGVIGAAMDCYETARSLFGAAQAVRR